MTPAWTLNLRAPAALMRLAFALAVAAALTMPAIAADREKPRTMTMTGIGEINAVPDEATVSLGVNTEAGTAAHAVSKNNAAMVAVMAALRGQGIADKDVATSRFHVAPNYEYPNNNNNNRRRRLTGYTVTNEVSVKVRNLGQLGAILDQAVSVGSNQVDNISFGLSAIKVYSDQARQLAVRDAVRKAQLYATAAGIKLGKIIDLNEGRIYVPRTMVRAEAMRAARTPVPIASGEKSVRAQVNITWEIE